MSCSKQASGHEEVIDYLHGRRGTRRKYTLEAGGGDVRVTAARGQRTNGVIQTRSAKQRGHIMVAVSSDLHV